MLPTTRNLLPPLLRAKANAGWFACLWAILTPVAFVSSRWEGVAILSVVAIATFLTGIVGDVIVQRVGGATPPPLLQMVIGLASRMVLVAGLVVVAYGWPPIANSAEAKYLVGLCVIPFYFLQLALEIAAAKVSGQTSHAPPTELARS